MRIQCHLVCFRSVDIEEDGQRQDTSILNVVLPENTTSQLDTENQKHRNQGQAEYKRRSSADSNEKEINIIRSHSQNE